MRILKPTVVMLAVCSLAVVPGRAQDFAAFKLPDSPRAFLFNFRPPSEVEATNAAHGVEGVSTIQAKGFNIVQHSAGATITFHDAIVCRVLKGEASVLIAGDMSIACPPGASVLVLGRSMLLADLTEKTFNPPMPTVQDIERMPFDEAYRLWLQEVEALIGARKRDPSVGYVLGSTDPKTGTFTPTSLFALTCRVAQDAHLHEPLLVGVLATNAYVSMILDASPTLCSRYNIESEAKITFETGRGYTYHEKGYGWTSEVERGAVWLAATKKPGSQDGAANGSQPIRSETNRTPSAAGFRR